MNYGNGGVSSILLPAKGGCSTSPDGQTCFDSLFAGEVGACALGLAKQQLPVPQQRSVFALFWFALIVFLCCSISDRLQWVIMLSYQLLCFAGFHLPFRFLSYSVQCV